MYNPVTMLAAGGLSSLVIKPQKIRSSADLEKGDADTLPTAALLPATRVI